MPDFSSPQTCIKPYQNRPRGLINALFLPTLKPEEPINLCEHCRCVGEFRIEIERLFKIVGCFF